MTITLSRNVEEWNKDRKRTLPKKRLYIVSAFKSWVEKFFFEKRRAY